MWTDLREAAHRRQGVLDTNSVAMNSRTRFVLRVSVASEAKACRLRSTEVPVTRHPRQERGSASPTKRGSVVIPNPLPYFGKAAPHRLEILTASGGGANLAFACRPILNSMIAERNDPTRIGSEAIPARQAASLWREMWRRRTKFRSGPLAPVWRSEAATSLRVGVTRCADHDVRFPVGQRCGSSPDKEISISVSGCERTNSAKSVMSRCVAKGGAMVTLATRARLVEPKTRVSSWCEDASICSANSRTSSRCREAIARQLFRLSPLRVAAPAEPCAGSRSRMVHLELLRGCGPAMTSNA